MKEEEERSFSRMPKTLKEPIPIHQREEEEEPVTECRKLHGDHEDRMRHATHTTTKKKPSTPSIACQGLNELIG